LIEKGFPHPKATSTGTTIVGCLFKDGIILGADTRATEGEIVADKNCQKVYQIYLLLSWILISERFTTSPNPFAVAAREQQLIPSSRQLSYHPIWNSTVYLPGESLES